MLHPANLLDILRNFTLFKTSGGRTIKIVPRYQQYRAVHEAIGRLLHNQTRTQHGTDDQRGGIIWHTQGSGKSLTMVYLIRKIRTIPALRRFKIVVVTDRTDLEKQLSDTAVLTGEPLQKAKTVKKLEEYLKQPGAGLVFGMIQKFKGGEDSEEEEQIEAIKKNLNPSEDILVLIDEAHRSHGSALHANLLEALPNCVRIGFTGTPIVKTAKKTTQQIFGSFIDQYNIRQSQADGVTLPILYEGLEARGAVTQGNNLDQLFEIIFQDKTPEERAQIKAQYATKTQVSEARELIKAKGRNMLHHYIEHILPGGFKAQVVASTRLAAVRYQEAFVEAQHALVQQLQSRAAILASLNPDALESLDAETRFLALAFPHLDTIRRLEFATVISADKNDDPSWKKWTDKSQQETHIERFKKPLDQDSLAIVIVKSMLLTGFDAPLEQVLYLDRGMKEKVPPIDILSLDFKTHVQRHRSIKAQAAEMEFAARHHISIHYDEDPVYYKNLSERLTEILESLADNWDEKVAALRQYIEQIQAGRPTNETGLDPKTQPFLNILREHSQIEPPKLAQATVEIVDRIRQQVQRVNWVSPIVQED